MTRSRGSAVWAVLLLGCVAMVGSSRGATDQIDTGIEDRRDAVHAASNVVIGQVVGERLYCLATSTPDNYVVYDHFLIKVERNLKGRLEGTVLVRQDWADTVRFGPDGRMRTGEKYLVMVRPLTNIEGYAIVDYRISYARIDGPEERAALTDEVRGYLAERPPTDGAVPLEAVGTEVPADTRATWDTEGTVAAATRAAYPTPFPCGPEIVATATAAAPSLDDGQGLGGAQGPPPPNATPFRAR